ncbi:methyltransferase domain-containing protein [Aliirhizobium cellulosilyticum]|uniref:Class I SAM-dependent methyltransferase n=1 Tax=Aliirhizobium cellulosilyticum TaxID=393664 RepID=A0A7W6S629_9HYPH|nr:hypothetical protein [Rhizobium cellulosilyticum]MBB4409685.1 hypothetical protein [Rhizobium cellulosilyticum]MBB4444372.1 hypothetical protein [Rhizobium cellulosilyticum]
MTSTDCNSAFSNASSRKILGTVVELSVVPRYTNLRFPEGSIVVATRNLEQYAEIHRRQKYGTGSAKARRWIEPWIISRRPASMLDYGAGQSKTVELLRARTLGVRHRFDPAIPEISKVPHSRYDIVTCTDVLEHLDEAEIPAVLHHIRSLTTHAIIAADTRPADMVLPNGENAHATVKPPEWWASRIAKVFGTAELIHVTGTSAIFRTWHASPIDKARAFVRRTLLRFSN